MADFAAGLLTGWLLACLPVVLRYRRQRAADQATEARARFNRIMSVDGRLNGGAPKAAGLHPRGVGR